ncbi:hypothetical protein GGX14DRAFT_415612 [Mycena pura]|uniref:Uncharacterized protein n=1 Tax=Mycena pura TaxID=153505 RepID=A0AAD7E4V4_9AGAR|nr:hypothetical protein GGX14DRAFT_415612 [Mycena pura]
MTIASIARTRPVSQARVFSSAGNAVRTQRSPHSVDLPPEKMRALIAMYHQAESFVTYENLSQKIDDAFTNRPEKLVTDMSLAFKDFGAILRARQNAPKVTEWNPQVKFDPPTGNRNTLVRDRLWSNVYVARDSKVIEALYGVETVGTAKALPGLEALEDGAEMIETSAQEDRARYEDSDF